MNPSQVDWLRIGLKRLPFLHQMARWLNQTARPTIFKWILEIPRRLIPRFIDRGLPRGSFSIYELLSKESITGQIILTDQGSPRISNPSVLLLSGRRQHLQQPWPIFWSHHKNVSLIGPSLVHINNRKEVCVEAAYGRRCVPDDPAYNHFIGRSPVKIEGSWTSIVSRWCSNDQPQPYAHWLLDALPRLALLKKFPANTGILIPPQKLIYQVESLKLLGLWDRCRPTSERHLLVEDYYFSAPTSMIVCHNPYSIDFLRSAFLTTVGNGHATPDRFFVRRRGMTRNIVNEEEVLDFFQEAGWHIVDPGSLSFAEQIQFFSGAKAIVGIHGSALANIVWCPPHCQIVELFADSYLAGDQDWISQCINADYHFMIFPSDHKVNAIINVAELKNRLKSLKLV